MFLKSLDDGGWRKANSSKFTSVPLYNIYAFVFSVLKFKKPNSSKFTSVPLFPFDVDYAQLVFPLITSFMPLAPTAAAVESKQGGVRGENSRGWGSH